MHKRKFTRANYEAMRDHLFDRIHKNGEQLKNDFPNKLRTAIEAEAWKQFSDGEGRPFRNLVEWLHYTFPNGVSMGQGKHSISYEEALKLTEGAPDVHRMLAAHAPHRGAGRRKTESNNGLSTSHFPRRQSQLGSVAVLSARLAQEKPKFYDRYLRGEFKTVTAAATEAGLLKDDVNLRRAKSAFRMMTPRQRGEFLAWMRTDDAKAK